MTRDDKKTEDSPMNLLGCHLSSKKGISPLFSTIVLIGFAIALGGILMSWGKSSYASSQPIIECKQTSISLVSHSENKGACTKGNELYFTIHNDGEADLDGIKVSLIGDKGIYSSTIDKQIKIADVEILQIGFQDTGKLEKVIFTPRFSYLNKGRLCPKNGFSIEKIGEC
ncbi:hypothetical protein KY358_04635 [Candidatus Woesearchaeota archaeon]|nr:hypothetical protein [Candidatus Woesearchaeota archaeon]